MSTELKSEILSYMKCMIFGSSGYLGWHLKRSLEALRHEVVIPKTNRGDRVDILNANQLDELLWDVDIIFFFAGRTGTWASFDESASFIDLNLSGLDNVLRHVSRSEYRPRIVFPSSRLVFKGSDDLLCEDAPKEAKTVYAATKLAGEHLLHAYAAAFELPFTICRISVPYGSRGGRNQSYGTIGQFVTQAKVNRKVTLYGEGQQKRTFTHIDDLCELIIQLGFAKNALNESFNLPGENLSLIYAAERIAEKYSAKLCTTPWEDRHLSIESGSTAFSGQKVYRTLGKVSLNSIDNWLESSPSDCL